MSVSQVNVGYLKGYENVFTLCLKHLCMMKNFIGINGQVIYFPTPPDPLTYFLDCLLSSDETRLSTFCQHVMLIVFD